MITLRLPMHIYTENLTGTDRYVALLLSLIHIFDGPGGQPLVDAAFFAQGLLRSKDQIWPKLDKVTQAVSYTHLDVYKRQLLSEHL